MARNPISELGTHKVINQPPPLEVDNLFTTDVALCDAVRRENAGWGVAALSTFGELMADEHVRQLGDDANRHNPELRTFDRFGRRIEEVRYHPAYHELMKLAVGHGVHSIAWTERCPGAHVVHSALEYLLTQAEPGVCCPITMTYAGAVGLMRTSLQSPQNRNAQAAN